MICEMNFLLINNCCHLYFHIRLTEWLSQCWPSRRQGGPRTRIFHFVWFSVLLFPGLNSRILLWLMYILKWVCLLTLKRAILQYQPCEAILYTKYMLQLPAYSQWVFDILYVSLEQICLGHNGRAIKPLMDGEMLEHYSIKRIHCCGPYTHTGTEWQ